MNIYHNITDRITRIDPMEGDSLQSVITSSKPARIKEAMSRKDNQESRSLDFSHLKENPCPDKSVKANTNEEITNQKESFA